MEKKNQNKRIFLRKKHIKIIMDSKIKKSTNKIIPPHLDCFNNNNLILSKNQLGGLII